MPTSVFELPADLAAKSDPALVTADEEHFAALTACLANAIDDVTDRLDRERRAPGGSGQEALERDQTIHRLTARLRTLRRFGLDVCLGRMTPTDGGPEVYVGRLGLTDDTGRRLLVDWRSPAAEPFFGATHANPMGLAARRRYRWTSGRITDYWDEVFTEDGLANHAALDDQSAFIASLGGTRSAQMRDVLGTIQADQDAIIRAGASGALVVDGGPGTGKTVVALHRCAYLLYSEPRLDHRHGGILFVGPHQPYLDYVADVLPSLGEEGVQTCTLRDLVPEGASAEVEVDPAVAGLKGSAGVVAAIDRAVRLYEVPPTAPVVVGTEWADVLLEADDWAEAFRTPDPGTPHNDARERIRAELTSILFDKLAAHTDSPRAEVTAEVRRSREWQETLSRAWPLLRPTDIVADLWSVPAYLRRCAPWLDADGVRALQRPDPYAWTDADLSWLDAARHRLGDPDGERRTRLRAEVQAAAAARMDDVIDDLIAADDSELMVMTMLRGQDARNDLVDEAALPDVVRDRLAGPFAHVVVDEAQELTDSQWQMLLLRCPSRSFTVVGDRAQARHGFRESWEDRLSRVGIDHVRLAGLTVNYRTPAEIMTAAEPVIRAVLPDANVPTSIRTSGVPVGCGSVHELDATVHAWLSENRTGIACVIGDPSFEPMTRVRSLTPELAKGLEFDLVVVVDPQSFGDGIAGGVDRYVAMTRAIQRLVVLTG